MARLKPLWGRLRLFTVLVAALTLSGCGLGYGVIGGAILLGTSDKNKTRVVVLFDSDAELVVSRGAADPGETTEGKGKEFVAAQFRFTATKATVLRRISLDGSGTGDDSALTQVRLHQDLNGDGVLDAADLQVGAAQVFASDNGQVSFGDLSLTLAAGQSLDLLVVLTTPAGSQEGDTFRVSFSSSGAIDAETTSVTGQVLKVPVFGVPLPSGTKTVSSIGSLSVRLRSLPEITALGNDPNVSVLQLELRASSPEDLTVGQLRLTTSGSGDEASDVVNVDLYVDVDENGLFNPTTDRALVTGLVPPSDNGALVFSSLGEKITAGQSVRWLVVYHLSGSASVGDEFRVDLLASNDVTAVGDVSAQAILPSGTPLGALLRITGTSAAVTVTQAAIPATTLAAGQTDAPVLHLVLSEGTGTAAVSVSALTVTGSGSGDEVSDLTEATLWRDVDQNGAIGPGDVKVGSGNYLVDNGTLTFAVNELIPAGGALHLLVAYSAGAPPALVAGESFQASLQSGSDLVLRESGFSLTASGLPQAGPVMTAVVNLPAVQATAGTGAPAAIVSSGKVNVPVLHAVLTETTGNGAVDLTQVTITALAQSGEDDLDLAAVKLWRDANGNSTFDGAPGDVQIAAGAYLSDAGSLSFSGLSETVPNMGGGALGLFVSYDFAAGGQVSDGEQYQTSLSALALDSSASGLPVSSAGLPIGGSVFTAQLPIVSVASGAGAPPANVAPLSSDVPVLHAVLTETTGSGAVDLTQVTITALAQSGEDDLDLAAVKLWRDTNGNSTFDGAPGDTQIAAGVYPADAGSLSFSGLSETVPNMGGGALGLFVTYDFAGSGQVVTGEQYQTSLSALALDASAGGLPVSSTGLPVNGSVFVAQFSAVSAAAGAGAPAANVAPLSSNVPVLHAVLTETTGNGAVDLTQFTITALAQSGEDDLDLTSVKLWRDANGSSTFDAGDTLIGAGAYLSDAGSINFSGLNETVPNMGGGALELFVTYDFAGSGQVVTGEQYQTSLSALALDASASGGPVASGGLPVNGGVFTAQLPAVLAAAGAGAPPANVAPLSSNVPVLHAVLTETTGNGAVDLTQFTITALAQSGEDDLDLTSVKLWRDANGSSTFDAGDALIGAGAYLSDAGSINFSGLNETVPNMGGGALELFVTYDYHGVEVTNGEQYQTSLSALALDASAGGAPVASGGLPVNGSVFTAQLPAVTVSQTVLGGVDVFPNQTNVVALELQLSETSNLDGARLKALNVSASGTGLDQDAIAFVRLHADNAPKGGGLGVEDTLIGLTTYFANDGTAAFAGLNQLVPQNGVLDLLVTYDMAASGTMTVGQTFIASLDVTSVTLVADTGGAPIVPSGGPVLTGRTLTVGAHTLQVGPGPFNPTGTLPLRASGTDAELLQLALVASLSSDVTVTSLEIQSSGTGNDSTGVAAAVLYRDVNGDGAIGVGDAEIQRLTTPFALNNGPATFSGLTEVVPAGTTVHWIVAYDLAPGSAANETFLATVIDTTKITTAAGTVSDAGLPAVSRTLSIIGGVTATLAPNTPPGRSTTLPEPNVGVLGLVLTADAAESMTVNTVTLTASGTAIDSAVFTGTTLWKDDLDNLFNAGSDTPIGGAQNFVVDNGTVTFTGLGEVLAPGASLTLWFSVNVDASPPAVPDASFRASLSQVADLSVLGGTTGSTQVSGPAVTGPQFTTGSSSTLFDDTVIVTDTISVPQGILDLAVADFDLDGDLDYAALRADGVVEIRAGDGLGGFSLLDVSGALAGATRLAVGKMGGDAHPDLIVINGNDSVSVFLNDGTGSFPAAPNSTSTNAGSDFQDLEVVDFDRDGLLDVVLADEGTFDQLLGYRGLANGNLAGALFSQILPGAPRQLVVADIDHDGFQDAVVTDDNINVVLVRGNGTFFAGPVADPIPSGGAEDVAAVDLDRDGFPDAIVVDSANERYDAFKSDGRATPGLTLATNALIAPAPLTKTQPEEIVVGDWNGDGRLDLAIVHDGVSGVVVRTSDGTLTLPGGAQASQFDTTAVLAPDRLAAADFDRDGDADLLVASSTDAAGVVQLLRGDSETNGAQATVAPPQKEGWSNNPSTLAVADFNLDGQLDFALASEGENKEFTVFLNDGAAASFTKLSDTGFGGEGDEDDRTTMETGDVNRDGRPDLVIAAGNRLRVFLGDGDGTFTSASSNSLVNSDPRALALGDINGDGILDAVLTQQGSFQVVRGNGTTGFNNVLPGDKHNSSSNTRDISLADVDNDGDLDVVILHQGRELEVFLRGAGGYSYSGAPVVTNLNASLGQAEAFTLGDINRDGILDVVAVSNSSAVIEVLEGVGNGAFISRALLASARGKDVALADLDKDGSLDIVFARTTAVGSHRTLDPALWTFSALSTQPSSPSSTTVDLTIGDMNRDGDLDVVVAAESGKAAQIFLGN